MFPPYLLLSYSFKTPNCISRYVRNKNWPVFINFAILVHPSVFLTAVCLFEFKHCLAENSYLHLWPLIVIELGLYELHAYQLDIIGILVGFYHIPTYSSAPQFPFPSSKPSHSTHLFSITIYYIIFPTTSLFNFAIICVKDQFNIPSAPNRIHRQSVTLQISGFKKSTVEKVQMDTLPVT
jgi:hypothetical protein